MNETITENSSPESVARFSINRVQGEVTFAPENDNLAIEEPMEVRLEHGPFDRRITQSVSITMRTPGHDLELALGFLFTEAIIKCGSDIESVKYVGADLAHQPFTNVVKVSLKPSVTVDLDRITRHFYTSSSCGVCGKKSIEALQNQSAYIGGTGRALAFRASVVHLLGDRLRHAQRLFHSTGGIHASALFDQRGELLIVREDVGRHNALDKLIGHALEHGDLPLDQVLLMVSGRASFELVQKASMAGIALFAAVGAPSSLAVALAKDVGMTLLGFVRSDRFNIYSHPERIAFEKGLAEPYETKN